MAAACCHGDERQSEKQSVNAHVASASELLIRFIFGFSFGSRRLARCAGLGPTPFTRLPPARACTRPPLRRCTPFPMFERKSVIDEGLIRASLAEEAELRGNAAEHAVEKDVLEMASRLALSYKNIARIDNLTGFHALTNLCLDNNVITTMENMEHLTNLKWLDLSFNNITKIEGLEKLVHLQDLSLFGNQIETIEGLSQCTDLNCLSMGNNNIKEYDSIVYLREFRSLRLVNLKGNPICEDQDYKM